MPLAPDLFALALVGALYLVGAWRLGARRGGRGVPGRQGALMAGAALVLLVAHSPPLHHAAHALVSAHMIQHMLAMTLAAPLLALARPWAVILWGLPRRMRRPLGRLIAPGPLARPAPATLLHAGVLWAWHAPPLYDLALAIPLLHWLEHLTMLAAACLFWHALLVRQARARHGYAIAALALLATLMHAGLLGALLTFAPQPLYAAHAGTTIAWGLDRLADQQLAGLIMWVPSCAVYLLAGLICVAIWLQRLAAEPDPDGGASEGTGVVRPALVPRRSSRV